MKRITTEVIIENFDEMVYVPIAVWAGPDHAHEGGGGGYLTMQEAAELGATNFRAGQVGGLVADWPQHYFSAASPQCRCASCQSPGRWEA